MRIDAHHHFWNYEPFRDTWISDDMEILKANFLPDNFARLLKRHQFDGSVLVQSDQSLAGNEWMIHWAKENSFIRGVVAWIDLRSASIEKDLENFRSETIVKGFRHVLQGEENRSLMLEPDFLRGIRAIGKQGYTYDILIFPDQLKYLPEFLSQCPNQLFVLDHLAKPEIKKQEIWQWSTDLKRLAVFPNLYCKISGMVTEADWKNWKKVDFRPYLDVVCETFGIERLMYGSDWPVCLLAATYEEQQAIVEEYFAGFSEQERAMIFGNNATRFYSLS